MKNKNKIGDSLLPQNRNLKNQIFDQIVGGNQIIKQNKMQMHTCSLYASNVVGTICRLQVEF